MSFIKFKEMKFKKSTMARINQANEIIDEYLAAGYRMTLRQLYYQFVSRDLLANTERTYKNLAKTISDARLAGLVDWDAIEDRGRQPDIPNEWNSIEEVIETAIQQFRLPRWDDQEFYAELWVEKQALAGVLEPLADKYHVPLMVNKGYSSQSAMYESACRFMENERSDKPKVLFYLGDLDPSGEDMVRDIRDRMEMFGVRGLVVEKVAINMDQVEKYGPPPNPAKVTDPRAAWFIEEYGESSWEVDALPPDVLEKIIHREFKKIIDRPAMNRVQFQEDKDKERIREAIGGEL